MDKCIKIYKKYYLNKQCFFSYDILDLRITITHNCNYQCIYCYDKTKKYNKQFLNLTNIIDFIKINCLQYNKYIMLTVLGGEPTLHPDLFEFCQKIHEIDKILGICIYTNFSIENNFYLKFLYLNKIKFIFSYHLQNVQFYEKLLQLLNSNKNIKDMIGLISIIYNNLNIQQSIITYKKIKKLNLNVGLAKIFQFNLSKNVYTQLQLNILNMFNKFLLNEKSMFFDNDCFIKEVDNKIEYITGDLSETNNPFISWNCNAGIDSLFIDVNGNIYPCQSMFYTNYKPLYNIYNIYNIYSFNRKTLKCTQKICCNLDVLKYSKI